MKLLLSFLLVFILAEVFCEEVGQNEDVNYWTHTSEIPDDWLVSDPFKEILRRMTRKPRPHQFFGLMGKRSPPNPQITRKNHQRRASLLEEADAWFSMGCALVSGQKLNSFVGLMGKRSQEEPDSYEWNTEHSYGQR